MSCSSLGRWLDDGRPAEARASAEGHARECPACARQLRAMDEIEDLLSGRFAAAPAAFTDRVMAALPPRAARLAVPDPEPEMPWWVRMLQEPLVAGSLIASAALLAALPALTRAAAGWMPQAQALVEHGALRLDAMASSSALLILPAAVVLAMVAAPQLVRAFAAAAGDPSSGDV